MLKFWANFEKFFFISKLKNVKILGEFENFFYKKKNYCVTPVFLFKINLKY